MVTDQNCKQKHIKNENNVKTNQDTTLQLVVGSLVDNQSLPNFTGIIKKFSYVQGE